MLKYVIIQTFSCISLGSNKYIAYLCIRNQVRGCGLKNDYQGFGTRYIPRSSCIPYLTKVVGLLFFR